VDATLASVVCSMQHDQEYLFMGTKEGDVLQMLFRRQ
jgi:hypothetical protein